MLKRVIILFLVLNFAVAGGGALQKYFAEPEAQYSEKVERQSDIVGYWVSIPLPEDMKEKINAKDPWPATPHHALVLYDDGRTKEIKSAAPFALAPAEMGKSLDRIKNHSRWELANGILKVRSQAGEQPAEAWTVFLVMQRHEKGSFVVQPGDLLMLLTNEMGQPVFYRHMRKVKE